MSEWKVGDKGHLELEFLGQSKGSSVGAFKSNDGAVFYLTYGELLRSIPSQPAPVDVSQIKVGDEVTVRGVAKEIDKTSLPFRVELSSGEYVWAGPDDIISHTPSRPPSTLAEFKALTDEQQERWFNEMVKGKVTT